MTVKTAAEIFRDYQIDGNPGSGAHKPIKADIREFFAAIAGLLGLTSRTVTTPGDVTIANSDAYVRLNKATPAASNVLLPAVASYEGDLLTIKDVAGNAGTYNFTVMGSGSEDIDGVTTAAGGYVCAMNYQTIQLRKRTGGWDVIHSG